MLDILIKDGLVIDGTGGAAYSAHVGVAGGRIVRIGTGIEAEAARTVDARGLHVAPGFIDPHTHSGLTLLADPRAESKIRQGVTTEVVGNCGMSPAPLLGEAMAEVQAAAREVGVEVTWRSTAEYLERLSDAGMAVNVVPLVGHSVVRGSILGYGDAQPTPEQQAEMERLVAEAMAEGARGFSSGLFYPPGQFARTVEIVALARVAASQGGIYATHIRNEGGGLLEAVSEAIEIGERAGASVEIAHLKLAGFRHWAGADRLLALLEEAVASGVRVGCDQYPYAASSTWLSALLPYWAQAGGAKAIARRLSEPAVRAALRRDWDEDRAAWEDRRGTPDWSGLLVSDCTPRPDLLGKSIAEIAGDEGKDPLEVAFHLIVVSDGQAGCIWFNHAEENVRTLMRHPLVVVGSDGSSLSPHGVLGQRKPHPRNFGTFPRVLGRYVREERVLGLEEAVKKMTSVTAERFGLTDRGVIREGGWADLVLFDAATVTDRATFADPQQYPAGIPYVIVNGVVVVEHGEHTGALPGRVL